MSYITRFKMSETNEMNKEAWEIVCKMFPLLDGKPPKTSCTAEELKDIVKYLFSQSIDMCVIYLVLNQIEKNILHDIGPKFWNAFQNVSSEEKEGFEKFKNAVSELYDSLSQYENTLDMLRLLECRFIDKEFKTLVHGLLLAKIPFDFELLLQQYFSLSFKVFCKADNKMDHDDSAEEGLCCSGCGLETDQCSCLEILTAFKETNKKLLRLGLMERLAGEQLRALIYKRIENHVQETCKGSFVSHLSNLEKWLKTVVMGWIKGVYGDDPETKDLIDKCDKKLTHFLYENYTKTRVEELFNIIIEFPDSQPALVDLKVCLDRTELRGYLTEKLQLALKTRLLHPGANTVDILITYIAAIRALRLLDPSGVLLDTVTTPVRQYLRQREDTVRCVVTSLTEEGPSELAEELAQGNALDEAADSDDDTVDWKDWRPPPIDADLAQAGQSRRTSDIISMLVNVYGSKELFVNEYRILLADRLLSQFNYNNLQLTTDKEIRYLELLKRRFGDSQLHYCEVMLKDVHDSRRMNVHLHSDSNFNLSDKDFPCNAIILSAQFWPPFKEETLEVPPIVKEHLENYTKAFETLKGNRTLSWKPHLGYVNLDIELKDRKLNLTVSPIHATIIWHFQNQSQWTIEELSHVMKMSGSLLRRKISFWQSQGILREQSPDVFVLIEEGAARSGVSGRAVDHVTCEDEETESALASAHEQREGELQVFWSYIVGMLTNLDSLPLERIHQMLKMFASQGPSAVECSQQELRHFLDRKVREHQLLFSGGLYKLPKP